MDKHSSRNLRRTISKGLSNKTMQAKVPSVRFNLPDWGVNRTQRNLRSSYHDSSTKDSSEINELALTLQKRKPKFKIKGLFGQIKRHSAPSQYIESTVQRSGQNYTNERRNSDGNIRPKNHSNIFSWGKSFQSNVSIQNQSRGENSNVKRSSTAATNHLILQKSSSNFDVNKGISQNSSSSDFHHIHLKEKNYQYKKISEVKKVNPFKENQGIKLSNEAYVLRLISQGKAKADQGNWSESKHLLQNALKANINIQNKNQVLNEALITHHIGVAHNWLGNSSTALSYLHKAFRLKVNIFGNIHLENAETLRIIGMIYGTNGNYNDALCYLRQSREIEFKLLGCANCKTDRLIDDFQFALDCTRQTLMHTGFTREKSKTIKQKPSQRSNNQRAKAA